MKKFPLLISDEEEELLEENEEGDEDEDEDEDESEIEDEDSYFDPNGPSYFTQIFYREPFNRVKYRNPTYSFIGEDMKISEILKIAMGYNEMGISTKKAGEYIIWRNVDGEKMYWTKDNKWKKEDYKNIAVLDSKNDAQTLMGILKSNLK